MFKLSTYLLLIFICSMPLFASDWSLQVRGAYFASNSKVIRKVSSKHWFDYQMEAAYDLGNQWQVWTNVSWFVKKKKEHFCSYSSYYGDVYSYPYSLSSERHFRRRLFILPISVGMKYHFCFLPCTDIYLGAGLSYTFLKIRHAFPVFYKQQVSKQGLGVLIKSGVRYDWGEYTFIDVFVDYLYQRLRFSHFEPYSGYDHSSKWTNIGGLKVGMGVGVYF